MNHLRENPTQNAIAIIPARFAATRLPGKLLLPLAGKPLILHTFERAGQARNVERVIVATDDERILQVIEAAGGEAVLTSEQHQSGSDRVAEVAANLPANSIIINVQADEPLISPRTIEIAVAALQQDARADIATTCEKITDFRDVLNPNAVKVVTDADDFALYFSRSPIPFPRDAAARYDSLSQAFEREPELLAPFRKHTGLYVYRREFLLEFTRQPQTILEQTESLEQLRALSMGARIKVVTVSESSIGVDTPEDFERVRQILARKEEGAFRAA